MSATIPIERRTLASELGLSGLGLHSGAPVTVRIFPGEAGIAFRHAGERTLATPDNVSDTSRCTKLGGVSTIEHLMSAFAGLGVTDAEVELTAPELPGLDGSAAPYVEAMARSGLVALGAREVRRPFKRVLSRSGSVSVAAAAGTGRWRYDYESAARWPYAQSFEAQLPEAYAAEVAPARTFALVEELPALEQAGLGRGLDAASAVVLGPEGYANAVRFADEPARHKLLDLVGDMYLAGLPPGLLGVVGVRSGHRANVEAARLLWECVRLA